MSSMETSSLQAPVLSDSSPDQPEIMDTEMTGPLTSTEHRSRSRSSSPVVIDTMASYPSGLDRNDRMGFAPPGRSVRGDSMSQGPHGGAWRYEENVGSPSAQPFYPQQYDPTSPIMPGSYNQSRPRGSSFITGENNVPLSTVCPGAVWPTEDQLNTAYAYGIRRDDGSITRLMRADELTNINIPPCQGPEGLIIVPAPRQVSPNRRTGESMIPGDVVTGLPALKRVSRPGLPLRPLTVDATQSHIDSIVAQSASMPSPIRRREKIYCDKWIHEGVCAFTQMGCKYKHEMPTDKITQLSLGLNHGIPNWYRRAYAVNLHPQSPPSLPALPSPPNNGNRTEGMWRRIEGGQSIEDGGLSSRPRDDSRTSYGPIGPPPPQGSAPGTTSPYSSLKLEEHEHEDEDDEELTWKGRHN